MSKRRKPSGRAKTPFFSALTRFVHAKPQHLAETIASDVIQMRELAQRRIEDARKEIEDGARPRRGRFRL